MMPLPHRLPRSEIGWQVPPWATRAEPPRDAFQYQTMVTESVAPLALIRWHHRFDSRPELIRNHTHSRHRSIVAGQRLPIRETRPKPLPKQLVNALIASASDGRLPRFDDHGFAAGLAAWTSNDFWARPR